MFKKRFLFFVAVSLLFMFIPLGIVINLNLRERRLINRLVNNLSHKNNIIRDRTIDSLERIGKPAIPALIKTLETARDDQVKINIIQLLSRSQNSTVLDSLCNMLKSNNWRLRFFGAQALGQIKNKNATEALLQLWLIEDRWQVKREVAIALAKIEDKKTVPIFLETYRKTDDNKTKIFSAIVLYKLLREKKYFNIINDFIHSQDYQTRFMTIWTLGELEDPVMIPLLREALDDKDAKIIKLARDSIEKLKEKYSK